MTTGGWPRPDAWTKAYNDREQQVSSWAGPRPLLLEQDRTQLVGREDDVRDFFDSLRFKRIVHLIGGSGVGKSSLLMAAIVPAFEDRRYTAVLCRDWSNVRAEDFDAFLAQRLHASLPPDRRNEFSDQPKLFFQLDRLPGRCVVVLDQFEEVARHSATVREAAFQFVVKLYQRTQIPIVLSYRSEYRHVFESLDKDLRVEHDHTRVQQVHALDPKWSVELMQRPRETASGQDWREVITAEAADAIRSDWDEAGKNLSRDRIPVGMLNLQALLFVLSSRKLDGPIELADYQTFAHEADEWTAVTPHERMVYALQACATERATQARTVARGIGMDEVLGEGIELLMARVLPRLSSGGFKIELDVAELAKSLLSVEIGAAEQHLADLSLGIDGEATVDALIRAFTTVSAAHDRGEAILASPRAALLADRLRLAGPAPAPEQLAAVLTAVLAPAARDRIGSGLVRGLGPVHVLVEQLRRLGWALVWLHELNLARTDADHTGSGKLLLVHDGLGDPLREWSQAWRDKHPDTALTALVAPQGAEHSWRESVSGTASEPRLHVNLKLDGNSVIATTMRHAVFVNCSFLGTAFIGCTFDGVTFLNCELDGALFSDCVVTGAGPGTSWAADVEASADEQGSVPTYALRDVALRDLLLRYRENGASSDVVTSPPPGTPAAVSDDTAERRDFAGSTSGLEITGSRLSSLTFRGTVADGEGATVRFVNVRGSGLDIAEVKRAGKERTGPGWAFRSSLVRHASFTSGEPCDLDLSVSWSVLAQWWIGDGLRVSGEIADSLITQLRAPDGTDGLRFDENCVVDGILGVPPLSAPAAFAWPDAAEALVPVGDEARRRFVDRIVGTDYLRP